MFFMQINEVTSLLTKEGVTVIGVLLTVCAFLIWDKIRQEKKYDELLKEHMKDAKEDREVLINLVKNTTDAINNIANVYEKRV